MYIPLKAEATDLTVDGSVKLVEVYENLTARVDRCNVIDASVLNVFKPLCIATRLKNSM